MLKEGREFLDSVSLEELADRLAIPVVVVDGGAGALVEAVTRADSLPVAAKPNASEA